MSNQNHNKVLCSVPITEDLGVRISNWRRKQPIIPSRAQALVYLVNKGLAAEEAAHVTHD